MKMEPRNIIQKNLKNDLQVLVKREFSDSETWEAYFNLSGFFKVLNQMRKEAVSYGNTGV
jgi:hypothetical protein